MRFLYATGALLLFVAGCAAPSVSPQASGGGAAVRAASTQDVEAARARGVELDAELDRATGAVILPYERYSATPNEISTIVDAGSVLISRCAAARGVTFNVSPPVLDPIYDSELFYGPWTVAQAERFGFVPPVSDRDLIANGLAPGELEPRSASNDLTNDEQSVVDECAQSKEVKDLTGVVQAVWNGPWALPLADTQKDFAVFDTPDAAAALDDLNRCLDDIGLRPDPESPGYPTLPTSPDISVEQIGMALKTVACKDQAQFTERVAAVAAEKQAPIIVAYLDELVACRQDIDAALVEARAILAEEGL